MSERVENEGLCLPELNLSLILGVKGIQLYFWSLSLLFCILIFIRVEIDVNMFVSICSDVIVER